MSSQTLRADVDRYAGHHAMSFELARLTTVAALLGWLEAQEFHFEGFAIVEMLGHRKRAGRVRTRPIGGTCFLEVESESADGETLTEFVNVASLYAFTPCTEAAARLVGKTCNPSPVALLGVPYRVQRAMERIEREEAERAKAIEAGAAPSEVEDDDDVPFDPDADYDRDKLDHEARIR